MLFTLLVFCLISCKKSSNTENQPVKPVSPQPVMVDEAATLAYIAVVNASGDTLRSYPVQITN